MHRFLLAALAVSLLAARPLLAQRPGEDELLYDPRDNTVGFLLGLRGTFTSATTATGEGQFEGVDVATTWGTGGGILVGYGATRSFLVFASIDHTAHDSDNSRIADDITLYHFDLGVRYHLRLADERYVPYASLGFGGKQLYTHAFIDTLGVAHRATINGRAIVAGAGMQYFVSENFAIDGGLAVSIGSFGKIDVEGSGRRSFSSGGGTTTRVMIGVNWYPET